VSRRDSRELFAMFPNRFIDAEMRGELSERQAKLCRYIVRHGSQEKREARLTLAAIRDGVRWEGSDSTLQRELRSLRPAWIDYASNQGQRRPYVIRLTGLAVLREGDEELRPETTTSARLPHDFRKKAPQEPPQDGSAEADETHKPSGKAPPQKPPHDSGGSPLPLTSTEGSEVKAAGEEKLDHIVGKTTAAESEPEFPELLDRIEPNPYHDDSDSADPAVQRKHIERYLTPDEELERARRFDAMYPPGHGDGA
jgi:hypothetical protein